jgi:hypothetical protein
MEWDHMSSEKAKAWQLALANVNLEGLEYSNTSMKSECTRVPGLESQNGLDNG